MTASPPRSQPSTAEAPHVPAAFIHAISEEGTKAEAVAFLQKQWNENCALRAKVDELTNIIEQMLKAYDSGNLQMSSPELGEPENNIPMHRWHDEFIYYARKVLAVNSQHQSSPTKDGS